MTITITGTFQEIFDKVCTHLDQQGHQSVLNGVCQYRAPNGDRCAVGCLITDEQYSVVYEGKSIAQLKNLAYLAINETKLEFLSALQFVHDDVNKVRTEWPNIKFSLSWVAQGFGLNTTILKTLTFQHKE